MAKRTQPRETYTPRKYESDAAYGVPPLPRLDAILSAPCTREGCGRESRAHARVPRGWVRVIVGGSTEPARLYCSGLCATKGVALAELRIPGGAEAVAHG